MLLSDGSELPADLVVVGAGARPASSLVVGQLELDKTGGIKVDGHFKVRRCVNKAGQQRKGAVARRQACTARDTVLLCGTGCASCRGCFSQQELHVPIPFHPV